ncbi:MAG: hypothetical protein MUC50_01300 [Myxococcota bacterium]|jgi:hypothetical protein|nr:hypothetical protein [Myxococcota bacterium]
MYSIEKRLFGYWLTFGGTIDRAEMSAWLEQSRALLSKAEPPFGVFVDMRTLLPLTDDAQIAMRDGQRLYKEKGMKRSAVILSSAVLTMQFRRIAKETGIYDWERYINADKEPNWEDIALRWINEAIDPDKVP